MSVHMLLDLMHVYFVQLFREVRIMKYLDHPNIGECGCVCVHVCVRVHLFVAPMYGQQACSLSINYLEAVDFGPMDSKEVIVILIGGGTLETCTLCNVILVALTLFRAHHTACGCHSAS